MSYLFLLRQPPKTKIASGRPLHFSKIFLPVSFNSEGQAVEGFLPGKICFRNKLQPSNTLVLSSSVRSPHFSDIFFSTLPPVGLLAVLIMLHPLRCLYSFGGVLTLF